MGTPFQAVYARERLALARDGRGRLLRGLFAVLALASALAGWQYAAALARTRVAAQSANARQFLEQGRKNPHGAAHFGFYVFKPAQPLAVFDRGIEPWVGATLWLEAHKQNDFKYRPAMDAGAFQRFGDLTPAFILQLLAPLALIFLAYGSIAGERESGVLKLALAQGVSPRLLLLAKWAALLRAASGLLLPPTALAFAAALLLAPAGLRLDAACRAAWLGTAYGLYLAAWSALVLAVSAHRRSARGALLLLFGLWLGFGVLVPRFAALAASSAAPAPAAADFARLLEKEGMGQHSPRMKQLAREKALTQFRVRRVEDLPVSIRGIILMEGEAHGRRTWDRRFPELYDALERQELVHLAAGAFSPLQPLRLASMSLSGTDLSVHRDFAFKAERFRRDFIQVINEDVLFHAPRNEGPEEYEAGRELWEKVPAFSYSAPDVDWAVGKSWRALAALLAWMLAALMAMAQGASRLRAD